MGTNGIIFVATSLSCFVAVLAIQCYKCGEYNDGVGSITPCINFTYMKLIDCPQREHRYCIKYQSEGSVVRDCVGNCQEKETWGTRTLCCTENGCNSSEPLQFSLINISLALVVAFVMTH
ncbi:uncharacterized protein [Onthophagus taurus]|uniref:uncharacterized protein n=1 Tax=Onthophagus taurus TaxID=166361 RepID=UPI0039BEC2A4